MEYDVTIGLEVHAQLLTSTKIFCRCSTEYNSPPNTNTCPVCLGHPGVLPTLNKKVVEFAIMAALALRANINRKSFFSRKNYFYPDLPKGYQITQYEVPFATGGYIEIETENGKKAVRIREMHIEEDAGKSFHPEGSCIEHTLVDMNRCGIPLLEIVSEPDIRSPKEASNYLKRLRQLLRYLGICAGNMEEGNFRCDANISIKPKGTSFPGVRRELKNLNSFRFLEKALEWELNYQRTLVETGGKIQPETLCWDEKELRAIPMRTKETSSDYRYFPEPDLPPLVISDERIEEIKRLVPELPWDREKRFISEYGLRGYDATLICSERSIADYFEQTAAKFKNFRLLANWLTTELFRELSERKLTMDNFPVKPESLALLLSFLESDKINLQSAKRAFSIMISTGENDVEKVISEHNLLQISDEVSLETIVDDVLKGYPGELERYRQGKSSLFEFFIGQVMKKTKGKANPQLAREILKRKLSTSSQ